jgi:magnesium transporter
MQDAYSILTYNQHEMHFLESRSLDEILAQIKPGQMTWITLSGMTLTEDHGAVSTILKRFNLSPLLLDAIFSFGQQPLEDEFENCLFLFYEIVLYRPESHAHAHIKGCILLGDNFLLLFEQIPSGLFDATRRKVASTRTRAQQYGADYLLYLLFRTVVISYQQILSTLTEKFEKVEDSVIGHPAREEVYNRILELREELKPLNNYFVILINLVATVQEEDPPLVGEDMRDAFTHMLDHDANELMSGYEYLRAWVVELIDIHRANINESTNRIMKTLTVISTIFLPLTFIAGVYGMNFDYMPELRSAWGYPVILGVMALIAVGILVFLRIKRWM